jgi:hypothetical protein
LNANGHGRGGVPGRIAPDVGPDGRRSERARARGTGAERGGGEVRRVPTFLIEVIILLHDEVANGGSREARGGGERWQRWWAHGEEPQIRAVMGMGCGAIYTGVGAVVVRGVMG